MKLKAAFALGATLAAFAISSCAPPGGYDSPGAALSGDSGSQIPWNRPAEGSGHGQFAPNLGKPERPGLATGWGDERNSSLSYTSFTRSSQKPVGTDVVYYNDPDGIKAMGPGAEKVGAMQTAAGGLVEWGIKGGIGYLPAYKEYGLGGNYSRRLVAGKKGSSYSIIVKNRCKSPLEIVASVDGLDVQDGKTASYSKRGYIIAPGETLEIEGFRTSNSKVAVFEFSGVANSYANLRHGDTRNVGVIGLAVFTAKGGDPWTWMPPEVNRRKSANPFAAAP